jgi:hypothetical protein
MFAVVSCAFGFPLCTAQVTYHQELLECPANEYAAVLTAEILAAHCGVLTIDSHPSDRPGLHFAKGSYRFNERHHLSN